MSLNVIISLSLNLLQNWNSNCIRLFGLWRVDVAHQYSSFDVYYIYRQRKQLFHKSITVNILANQTYKEGNWFVKCVSGFTSQRKSKSCVRRFNISLHRPKSFTYKLHSIVIDFLLQFWPNLGIFFFLFCFFDVHISFHILSMNSIVS